LSIANRITGLLLSGAFYGFGAAYVFSPYFGWNLSADSLAATFATWPVALAFAVKALVAWPFAFHGMNGLRHIVWDFGKMITNKQVQKTGWVIVYGSIAVALGLAMI
jgi:succinate dehydrogenase (ubiquinone) cytochrome b560 subunit